ncbi:MAG: hypothetical protein KDD62_00220 [Bdellovibrionales bacterium]|nr:hypothetical protein [Bdellovibrionales bacterium]
MNILLLVLALVIGVVLAVVHYGLRFQRQSILTERLSGQLRLVHEYKRLLSKLESRSSLAQVMLNTRELLLDAQECVTELQGDLSVDTFDLIEQVLDILEDKPIAMIEDSSPSKGDLEQRYGSLRRWESRVKADLQSLVDQGNTERTQEQVVTATMKRTRKNTYLNLKKAGISPPFSS